MRNLDEHRDNEANHRLAENVMHFARALRVAGIPAGPAKVVDALAALEVAGVERREDWHAVLASVFLTRREQRDVFDQAFHIFWRDPALLERMMHLLLPRVHGRTARGLVSTLGHRVAVALAPKASASAPPSAPGQEIELDARLTFSSRERLQHLDLESMSPAELADAKAALARLAWPLAEV